jgi:hypothetical protein
MKNLSLIPQELIENKIYLIRGKKVMLDTDLAKIYEIETKTFNRAVKRNLERFPTEFMFQLKKSEVENLRCQIGTSSWGGRRYLPYVFTEYGVAMLSSVLNSKRAVQVNIQIIKTFVRLREMVLSNRELRLKIEGMEKKYDKRFLAVFNAIQKLLEIHRKEPTKIIGFRDRKKK